MAPIGSASMSSATLFYIFGIALTLTALAVSFAGLRSERFPPTGAALGGVVTLFAALVIGTAAFGVANAREEAEHRETEQAEQAAAEEPSGKQPATGGEQVAKAGGGGESAQPVSGPGGTLQLAADPAALEFDTTQLSSKPGEITIEFTNPAQIEHDVAILQDEEELAKSELIAEGETSVSAELAPGEYTFLCTVPGHAESGMQGTLSIK